jgi:MFS family permease
MAPARLRGRLSGGLVSAIFIGQFLSPLVSHPLVLAAGYRNAFILAAGVLIFIAAATMLPVLREKAA